MNQNTLPENHHLHQPIAVDASFSRQFLGHCRPLAFRTATGREVQISEIGLIHPKYDGLKTIFAFDVTDGSADYRICLDTDSLHWFLEFEGDRYEA